MESAKVVHLENLASLETELFLLTPEKASRLARHYLGLVQILREIAGESPVETGTQRRKNRNQ